MHLTVSHSFLPKRNSTRAAIVMDHFGIGFEQGRHVIADGLELPIRPGDVVLFTGASGSGKSSLLRATASKLEVGSSKLEGGRSTFDGECSTPPSPPTLNPDPSTPDPQLSTLDTGLSTLDPPPSPPTTHHPPILNIDNLDLGDDLLIDRLPLPVGESMRLLSACGLGEAHLLLRTPEELSDGQRYRFRLALALSRKPQWLVADEFTATLDRTLARVIAFNIRRLADRTGTGFLLATTHNDVAEDLAPDLHVRCRLDGAIEVERNDESPVRNDESGRKKKEPSPSPATCGSAKRPSPTGRTSLGGIIGVTMLDSRGS